MISYPLYRTRTTHALDGLWDLAVLGDIDPDGVDLPSLTYDHTMAVPGCWDTLPGLGGQRGVVALRTTVQVTSGTRGKLAVGGLGLWARVIVDGQALDDCHLPYCPWSVAIPASDRAQRELVILLDNRFGPDRALLFDPYFDWYAHGGIYRSLVWHELPEIAFERARVTTTDVTAGTVAIAIGVDGKADTLNGSLCWDDGAEESFSAPVTDGVATITSTIPQAQPWSPDAPNLHEVRLVLADGSDDIVERTGLRTLEATGGQILLNGEPLRLRGVNRHELDPIAGPALAATHIAHDVGLLKELGANFVRGSHYQQDQRFLDACDEQGIIVWEESLGWQARVQHFADQRFHDLQDEQVRRMIAASFNHPSVIMWGFLNEADCHEAESRPLFERLSATIRAADPSRLVTWACNHPFDSHCLDLVDVISINQYPAWYAQNPDDPYPHRTDIEAHLAKVLAKLEEDGLADRPKIMSEIGAGAIYGWRDEFRGHWSEEYQADYLTELCRVIDADPRWMGLAIWQFSDGRTYNGSRALGRPRAFNNKGLVNEYRKPKLGYGAVREAFTTG